MHGAYVEQISECTPTKSGTVKIIADNLKKRGWSLGWVSAIDSQERTIWIVNAHGDDGRRLIYGLTSSLRGGRLASGRSGGRHRFCGIAIFGLYTAGGWLLPGRKRSPLQHPVA